jgi:hypothetical protein
MLITARLIGLSHRRTEFHNGSPCGNLSNRVEQALILVETIDRVIEKAQFLTVPILDARFAVVNARIDALEAKLGAKFGRWTTDRCRQTSAQHSATGVAQGRAAAASIVRLADSDAPRQPEPRGPVIRIRLTKRDGNIEQVTEIVTAQSRGADTVPTRVQIGLSVRLITRCFDWLWVGIEFDCNRMIQLGFLEEHPGGYPENYPLSHLRCAGHLKIGVNVRGMGEWSLPPTL